MENVLIGHIHCKTINDDLCGTIYFISPKANNLFPKIKTIISHHSDYDMIISNMVSALAGRYDNFTMSEFIRASSEMPEFLARNA